MPRYVNMNTGRLTPQRRIRIINQHRPTGTTVTVVGPIIEVITEEYTPISVLQDTPRRVEMRPVAVRMIGDITMAIVPRNDWSLTALEEELPDLPHTRGAVILIDDRAAVLREVGGVDEDRHTEWFWADDLDRRPSGRQLEQAKVLHPGR